MIQRPLHHAAIQNPFVNNATRSVQPSLNSFFAGHLPAKKVAGIRIPANSTAKKCPTNDDMEIATVDAVK